MFEKGDIVEVVITSSADGVFPVITKGSRYVVNEVKTSCCNTSLDIGLTRILPAKGNIGKCPVCGLRSTMLSDAAYYHAEHFRKIQPNYKVVEVSESINEQIKQLILT